MSREIKFRKWHIELKDMSFWDGVKNCENLFWFTLANYPEMYNLMQFTGLKDKNGKEIYEGDIVSYGDDPFGIVKYNNKFSCYTYIEDDKLNDEFEVFDWSQLLYRDQKHYIIHGNIYENPELLNLIKWN